MVERIDRSAFSLGSDQPDVLALFNHDPNQLLGRASAGTLRLRTDDTGLKYSIDAETRLGQEVLHSIERGDITGSSFGFVVKEQDTERRNGDIIRTIRAVELKDVGPVSESAYQGTTAESRRRDELQAVIDKHKATQAALEQKYDG